MGLLYLLRILTFHTYTQQTQKLSVLVPLSVQITAARHVIKPEGGVGVAAVGNTCCLNLCMVGDPARQSVS
jgi:hypothetical protein